jgi:hypothetical protein
MMEGGELKVLLFPSKDYAFTGDAMTRFAQGEIDERCGEGFGDTNR